MKEKRTGYGNLTNIPKITEVYMVDIMTGTGDEDFPMRRVSYVYDKEFKLLHQYDPSPIEPNHPLKP